MLPFHVIQTGWGLRRSFLTSFSKLYADLFRSHREMLILSPSLPSWLREKSLFFCFYCIHGCFFSNGKNSLGGSNFYFWNDGEWEDNLIWMVSVSWPLHLCTCLRRPHLVWHVHILILIFKYPFLRYFILIRFSGNVLKGKEKIKRINLINKINLNHGKISLTDDRRIKPVCQQTEMKSHKNIHLLLVINGS